MAKVSIVVPVYNVEKYLARCLDSCINQSLQDIEIVCINDGSTDRSGIILEHYARLDSRMKIIYQENGGLSSARNTGVKNSTGKYILFVDSDDFISSIAAEKLFDNAEENNSDVVIFDYFWNHINPQGRKILSVTELSDKNDGTSVFNIDTLERDFYAYLPVTAWCKLYKKEFLTKNNITFLKGVIFEDVAYFAEIFVKAKRVTYISEPLYAYSVGHSSQIMAQNGESLFDVITVYKAAENSLKASNNYENFRHSFQLIMIRDFLMKLRIVKPELRERLFGEYQSLNLNIDYDYYETRKMIEEKICSRLFKLLMESKSYLDFFTAAGWEI